MGVGCMGGLGLDLDFPANAGVLGPRGGGGDHLPRPCPCSSHLPCALSSPAAVALEVAPHAHHVKPLLHYHGPSWGLLDGRICNRGSDASPGGGGQVNGWSLGVFKLKLRK